MNRKFGCLTWLKRKRIWKLDGREIVAGSPVELQLADGSWLKCRFFTTDDEEELPQLRVPLMGDEDPGAEADLYITEATLRWPEESESKPSETA